jgi:hypothetical protein
MSSSEGLVTRLIARIRAVLPQDWYGKAGQRFSRSTRAISDFAEQHDLHAKDLLGEGVELGRRKLQGLANHEFSQSTKNFAEAEKVRIEAELERRSLESKIRREESEARLSELAVLKAEADLLKQLHELGLVIRKDERGNLTVLPAPPHLNLLVLADPRVGDGRLLNTLIEELEVSVRSYNCLKRAHIDTIGDLVQRTEADLLRVKNMGRKNINELIQVLGLRGLCLGMRFDSNGNPIH